MADPFPGSLNRLAQIRLSSTDQANVGGMVQVEGVKVDESSPPIGVALEPSRMRPKQAEETYEIGA